MIFRRQRQERDEAAVGIDLNRRAVNNELRVSVANGAENEIRVARLNELIGTRVDNPDLQCALHERDGREADCCGGRLGRRGTAWSGSAAYSSGVRVGAGGERQEGEWSSNGPKFHEGRR